MEGCETLPQQLFEISSMRVERQIVGRADHRSGAGYQANYRVSVF